MRFPKFEKQPKEQLDFLNPSVNEKHAEKTRELSAEEIVKTKPPEKPREKSIEPSKAEIIEISRPAQQERAESLSIKVEKSKKAQMEQYRGQVREFFNRKKEFLAKILEALENLSSKKEIKEKIGLFVGNVDVLLNKQGELKEVFSEYSSTYNANMQISEGEEKRTATDEERISERQKLSVALSNLFNSIDLKVNALDSEENKKKMQVWLDEKSDGKSAFPPEGFKKIFNQLVKSQRAIDETLPQVHSILAELFQQKKFSTEQFRKHNIRMQEIESNYTLDKLNPEQNPQIAVDKYFAEIFKVINELAGEKGLEGLMENMGNLARSQYRLTHESKSSIQWEEQEILLSVKPQEYDKTGEETDKIQVAIGISANKPGPDEFVAEAGQFGWVAQDEFRYEGPINWALLKKVNEKDENGKTRTKIKALKVGFKNQELKDNYFLLLEGLQEDEEQREKRKQSELKTLDDIFSYLAGEKPLIENTELNSAQKDLLEMREVFALSRQWNKMPDWENFVKEGRYAYHSEQILKERADLSLEQAMLVAALAPVSAISNEEKKILAKYYSKHNQLCLTEEQAVLSRWQFKLKTLRGSLKTALDIPETLTEIEKVYLDPDIREKINAEKITAEFDIKEKNEELQSLIQIEEQVQGLVPPSLIDEQSRIAIAKELLAAKKKVQQEKERADGVLERLAQENITAERLEEIMQERRDRLMETGLLQRTWGREGKLHYSPGYKNDVFLIPSFDGQGRICGIRFRLIEPELSYYDDNGNKQTVRTNGSLETLDNKYRSYPRNRLENQPESLALKLHGGERLPDLAGQRVVLTEGEIKAKVSEWLTQIPHLAIRGISQVDDEIIQSIAQANLKELILVLDSDPEGGAQQRGYQENDAAVAMYRIGERLEQAGAPVRLVIWPKKYQTEQFGKKVGIDDLLLGQGKIEANIKEYQEMLNNAVSLKDYRVALNEQSYEENPYFRQKNKLNPIVEQYYNTHQHLRQMWEKCQTIFQRGGESVDKKQANTIQNCLELLLKFRNQATEFYLGIKNLDRPASMFESLNNGLVPEEERKFIFNAEGEELSIEGMKTNVIFHKFLGADVPAEEQLASGETLKFYDPDYEKNLWLKATALEIDKARTDNQTEKSRKIRSDILLGLNARGQFSPETILDSAALQTLEKICQDVYRRQKDIISPKDLLISLSLAEFNNKHQDIVKQCFEMLDDAEGLKERLQTRLNQFINQECSNRNFKDISNSYVIGSYFVPKFSQKEVEYIDSAKIIENQEGAIAEIAGLGDFAIVSKKSGRVISVVEHKLSQILAEDLKHGYDKSIEQQKQEIEQESDQSRKQGLQIELDARLNYYHRQVKAMNQDIYIIANAVREAYNKERNQYRQMLKETIEYGKQKTKNQDKAIEILKENGIARNVASKLVRELEIICLFPEDFFSPRGNENNLKAIFSKKGLSAKAGEAGLYELADYLNESRFKEAVLLLPIKTDERTYVGLRFMPTEDLSENDSLFLERTLAEKTGQEVFPLQSVAQESQRTDYFYNQQALANLPKEASRAIICFDELETLNELGRQKQETDPKIIEQNETSVVLGLNHSFSQLNEANLRKLINRGIREFVISIDDSQGFEKANSRPYFIKSFDAMKLELYSVAKIAREIAWKKGNVRSEEIVIKLRTPNKSGGYIEQTIEKLLDVDNKQDVRKKELEFNNRLAYQEVYQEALKDLSLPIKPPEYLKQIEDLTEVDFSELPQKIKDIHQRLILEKFARIAKRLRGLFVALNSEKGKDLDVKTAEQILTNHFVGLIKEKSPAESQLVSELSDINNLTDLFKLKLKAENSALPVKPVFLDKIAGIKAA